MLVPPRSVRTLRSATLALLLLLLYSQVAQAAPPSPAIITVPEESFDASFVVSWTSNQSGTSNLQERFNGGTWTTHSLASGVTSKSFSGKADGEYEYRARVCHPSNGCGAYGSINKIVVEKLSDVYPPVSIGSTGAAGGPPIGWEVTPRGELAVDLPFELPAGVNDHTPELGLSYRTGGRARLEEDTRAEGTLGYGWELTGVPEIRRCRAGIGGTIALNTSDRLCLNGQPLVPRYTTTVYWSDTAEYLTESSGYARIVANGLGLANRSFVVYTEDGRTLYFGDTAESRVESPTSNTPYLWSLSAETDSYGNAIDYTYEENNHFGTNFLTRITYGAARIDLRYSLRCGTAGCDTALVQGSGVPQIDDRGVVLNRVLVYFNSKLLREYRLQNTYDSLIATANLLLRKIQRCGRDESGSATTCQRPIDFLWTEPVTTNPAFEVVLSSMTAHNGVYTALHAIVDGEDLQASGAGVYRAPSSGFFGTLAVPASAEDQAKERAVVVKTTRPATAGDDSGDEFTTSYRYGSNPLYDSLGRGFIGFASTTEYSDDYTTYDPSSGTVFSSTRTTDS